LGSITAVSNQMITCIEHIFEAMPHVASTAPSRRTMSSKQPSAHYLQRAAADAGRDPLRSQTLKERDLQERALKLGDTDAGWSPYGRER
jgi:hypothetical protein